MTDADNRDTGDTDELAELSTEQVTPYDYPLELVLNALAGGDRSFDLTVLVDGELVTGTAIGKEAWVSAWMGQLRVGGMPEEAATELERHLLEVHASIDETVERLRAADKQAPRREYLYMRDVRFVGMPDTVWPLWRIRLSQVAGWSLGAWKPNVD